MVQLDGFVKWCHLLEEHDGYPRQPHRHLLSSMLAESTAPAACVIIEGNAVTSNQQVGTDLLTETHPPTPRDLIPGLDRIEGMLSDKIKVCECAKHPRMTSTPPSRMPLSLRNAAYVASRYMKRKIHNESGP
jgi:hypothetical protein